MNTMPPAITSVHLIGSIPLSTTEEVLRTVSSALPTHLRRIPDGETGERWNFATWQVPKLGQWPLTLNSLIRGFIKCEDREPPFTDDEKLAVLRDMEERLETDYEIAALESYEVFRMLKGEGVIKDEVRFLVALPTPLTIEALFARAEFQVEFERVYEKAILRALRRVQEVVPSRELSIQWDAPLELGMVEGVRFEGRHSAEKWWEGGMVEGAAARLARLCDSVEEGVEVGVHLCYGDMHGKHFIEPKDTSVLVGMATALLDRTKRSINFIHVPVPRDRTDDRYFEALEGLSQYVQDGNELCLGLLHPNDPDGTKERIQAAGKFVSAFSVSSECGLGRRSKQEFQSVLEIAAGVSDPVDSKK